MLSRPTLLLAVFSIALVASLAAGGAYVSWERDHAVKEYDGWHAIAWPFPRDGWNDGQAWRGHGLDLYIRPKLGLCGNCDTGVVEDSEVDRVTDIDLVDPLFAPDGEGKKIRITDLVGRMRLYRLRTRKDAKLAEGIAVSYGCDLVVALVVGDVADEKLRQTARRFLESNVVQVWLNQQLGER